MGASRAVPSLTAGWGRQPLQVDLTLVYRGIGSLHP